jgi:predicted nuclease of predicted toxin-antitoxin system
VKLLFDQNLSPRLVPRLSDLYPTSSHVAAVSLSEAADQDVWEYARAEGFIIVTKDSDFNDTLVLRGFPPKVVWLRLGNCTTGDVERVLRRAQEQIAAFARDPEAGILELL